MIFKKRNQYLTRRYEMQYLFLCTNVITLRIVELLFNKLWDRCNWCAELNHFYGLNYCQFQSTLYLLGTTTSVNTTSETSNTCTDYYITRIAILESIQILLSSTVWNNWYMTHLTGNSDWCTCVYRCHGFPSNCRWLWLSTVHVEDFWRSYKVSRCCYQWILTILLQLYSRCQYWEIVSQTCYTYSIHKSKNCTLMHTNQSIGR